MDFKNKVAIVTGASSGIGAAVAVGFSTAGANVVMAGRNEKKLTSVAGRCPTKPLIVLGDVSKDDDLKRIIDQTVKTFGKIDILVNNAGFSFTGGILDGNMMESYDATLNVNLRSLVHLTTLAVPYLVKTKGNIVNVSSVSGVMTPVVPGAINYYVSKAAVIHFGACAAAELASHGIRVNTVSPGPVRTDFIDNSKLDFTWDTLRKKTSLNRVSEPEEIADVVLFLASDKAKGITGANFIADNGIVIKRE